MHSNDDTVQLSKTEYLAHKSAFVARKKINNIRIDTLNGRFFSQRWESTSFRNKIRKQNGRNYTRV